MVPVKRRKRGFFLTPLLAYGVNALLKAGEKSLNFGKRHGG